MQGDLSRQMSGMLQEGTVFAGRFRVVRLIAAGGMGAVYEVVHLETERRRALKVMHPHILLSDEMRGRFKLETKVAAHIESDFIVDVFDAGVDETTKMPFLVMELLRGEDLGSRLKRLGRLPPEEVVLHLQQAALALDKTHKSAIVHRDLKPENLFLAEREDSPPRIKVLDFGIAKIVAESATSGGTTESIGSPLYMSPEQFDASSRLSGASDIYALGMIAYTLLVGVSYWYQEARAGNVFALAVVAMHGPPQPARARASAQGVALPPAFDAWFATATSLNPSARFPTATAAVRALAEVFEVPLLVTGSAAVQGAVLEGALTLTDPASKGAAQGVASGPGATSHGTAVTQQVRQGRSSRGLMAIGLTLLALGALGGIFYGMRSPRPSSAAFGEAQVPKPTVSAEAQQAPPAMAPTPSPIPPAPSASASASARAAPASRPPATTPVKKKYTQE